MPNQSRRGRNHKELGEQHPLSLPAQKILLAKIHGAFTSFPYSGTVRLHHMDESASPEANLQHIFENIAVLSELVLDGIEKAGEQEKALHALEADVHAVRRVFGIPAK